MHLIQRERKHVVEFPSLMFLRRIPYQSVRRRRIRHWMLLLMRLAALALIVLAFARPFFRSADPSAAAAGGAREVVILVDRSYSMGYGDRWARALAAARDAIERAQRRRSRVARVLLVGAEVALRSTADKGRLQAALAPRSFGAGATRYGPALKLAGSILSASRRCRAARSCSSPTFSAAAGSGADDVRLPEARSLTPVAIGDAETANLSVTPVSLQRSTFSDQERVTVTAGVVESRQQAGVGRRRHARDRRPRDPDADGRRGGQRARPP